MSLIQSKDGTAISYVQKGSGQTLLLVGGALQTKEDRLFSELLRLLSKDFKTISYDRRGRGDSGVARAVSAEAEIEDLNALIESTGGPVFLFGNSSGAHLALKTALVNSKVCKVALYEAPFISDRHLGSANEYVAKLNQAISEGRHDQALKFFFLRIGIPRFAIFAMKFMPMWKDLKKLAPTLYNDAILVGDGSVPPEFKSISVPTLVLSGSSERMKEAAKQLANQIPNSQFQILPGQKHAVDPIILSRKLCVFFS